MSLQRTENLFQSAENDRRRIARELHDDIGQRLALFADEADQLRRDLKLIDDSDRRRLDRLVVQARTLGEDLRRISHALHPAILEDLGLVTSLRSLLRDFSDRTGLPARFADSNVPTRLPLEFSTSIYRIVQEAVRNVAKHAGYASVGVSLTIAKAQIVLVISDTGDGFPSDQPLGLGLTSMRERAELIGGTLHVFSAPAEGTVITVRLPLPDE